MSKVSWLVLAFSFIAIAVFAYLSLSNSPLEFWDEATNVAVVKERANKADFWNLSYNSSSFWEKPPLYYWVNIVLAKFFLPVSLGQLLLQMRLVSLLAAIGTMLLTVFYLRGNKYFVLVPLFFLAIPALWLMNPAGTFATHNFLSADADTLQIFFIMSGIVAVREFAKTKQQKFLLLVGVFSGLAILTKGIFGFLPLIYLVLQLFIGRANSVKEFAKAVLAFLLVSLPWHVYMVLAFGGNFFNEYVIYHQLSRGAASLEGHTGSLLFHSLLQLNPLFSGQLLLILVLVFLLRKKLKPEPILWLYAITLLLISLVQTKLSWYGIYLYPLGVIIILQLFEKLPINFRTISVCTVIVSVATTLCILVVQLVTPSASAVKLEQIGREGQRYTIVNYRLDRIYYAKQLFTELPYLQVKTIVPPAEMNTQMLCRETGSGYLLVHENLWWQLKCPPVAENYNEIRGYYSVKCTLNG